MSAWEALRIASGVDNEVFLAELTSFASFFAPSAFQAFVLVQELGRDEHAPVRACVRLLRAIWSQKRRLSPLRDVPARTGSPLGTWASTGHLYILGRRTHALARACLDCMRAHLYAHAMMQHAYS